MGGIGGKGKGARRRQKLKENAKVFDKKTGSFREPKIELIDGQVSREELLKAPSSFRRFMEATRRAKEQRDRRDRRARVARGLEGSDDDERGDDNAAERKKSDERETRDDSGGGGESDTDDETTHTWLRPDQGDGGAGVAEDVAFEEAAHSKKKQPKKKKNAVVADAAAAKDADAEDDAEGRKGKRKYKSLRERKSEARKAAKAAREEGDAFIGVASEASDGGRAGAPTFGEVADAPPTITLKRKSGGKGAKAVPVAESGHKIAGSKGAGNRQAQIFAKLMAGASGGAAKGRAPNAVVGLRRAAEIEALRERAISEYRKMKGRPMNNGRNSSLAADPTRLFSSVGGANVRRDAGRERDEPTGRTK